MVGMYDQVNNTRWRSRRSNRCGATLAETAIVLGVFMIVLLGFLDLGLVLLRQNSLTAGVGRLSREACLRGQLAPPQRTAWGPDPISTTAEDESEIAAAIRPTLVGIDRRRVQIQLEWPDGGNEMGQRVRVTATCPHDSIFPFLFGPRTQLRSICVMRINH
jgi:hypothetical protein